MLNVTTHTHTHTHTKLRDLYESDLVRFTENCRPQASLGVEQTVLRELEKTFLKFFT